MTGKEYNILDEIRADVKNLLQKQAASEERVRHCRETFADLKAEDAIIRAMAEWSKGKILANRCCRRHCEYYQNRSDDEVRTT
jgi:hypothetical protein